VTRSSRKIFGVGCAKSGTHSLAKIFEDVLGAIHEPEEEAFIQLIHRTQDGQIDQLQLADGVERLVRRIDQPVNVSQINGFLVDILFERFPDAGYIFTLRDAASWVRSFTNHQLTLPLPASSAWQTFRDIRFRPDDYPPGPDDGPLARRGLYSLEGYLAYWKRHNLKVLQTLGQTDFLILPTNQISQSANQIAKFAGLDTSRLAQSKSHDFAGRYIESPIDDLDVGYFEDRIDQYTNDLQSEAEPLVPAKKFAAVVAAICHT